MDPTGQTLDAFSQPNNRPGTEQASAHLLELLSQGQFDGLRIAAEATNWYWLLFFQQLATEPRLKQWPLELYAFNPRVTAKYRETFQDMDKDDPEDAFVLTDRLRLGRELPHPFVFDVEALALRTLTRLRCRLTHDLVQAKLYCLQFIYLKASDYTLSGKAAFGDPFGASSIAVLTEFASLEELAAIEVDELAGWLEKKGRSSFVDVHTTARKLQMIAQDSYQLPEALLESVNLGLKLLTQQIAQIERLRKQLDRAIDQRLATHPNALLSIPGIGPVYAAGIIAEIGDIWRFEGDEAKVAKFAGLKWRKTKSAERRSEETPLTRRGNHYLRYYLCEAANSVRMREAEYAAYYQKKYNEVPKHKHKRAVTLRARKLVRLVVRLLTTNQSYQPRRQATSEAQAGGRPVQNERRAKR